MTDPVVWRRPASREGPKAPFCGAFVVSTADPTGTRGAATTLAAMNEHQQRAEALVQAYLESPAGDGPAGTPTPEAFAAFAAARGAAVRIVHGEDGEHPGHPRNRWVRVFNVHGIHGYDVDVDPGRYGDAALPPALVWRMDGRHPVTGVHRTLRVTRPDTAAGVDVDA